MLARKSGLKVSLLYLGPACPLQIILLSDLVGCDNPLQIEMAVWCALFYLKIIEDQKTAIIVSSGLR